MFGLRSSLLAFGSYAGVWSSLITVGFYDCDRLILNYEKLIKSKLLKCANINIVKFKYCSLFLWIACQFEYNFIDNDQYGFYRELNSFQGQISIRIVVKKITKLQKYTVSTFIASFGWMVTLRKLQKEGLSSHGLPKRSPTLVLTVPKAA